MRGPDRPARDSVLRVRQLAVRAAPLLEAPWFGYLFGVAVVLLTTALLAALAPTRLANASALYAIPVLLTAARYGRGPAV